MAICIPKAAGGKFSATTTWEEGKVPTAEDDVIFESTSGNVEISAVAVCRSFDALNYKGVLTNKSTLTIGTTTSAVNKVALRLSASMTWTNGVGSSVNFKSSVGTALIILQAGHGISQMNLLEGKYELSGALIGVGSFQINAKAELKSNSAEIKVPTFAASEKAILAFGTSKVFITETTGSVLTIGGEVTITGTSTWEVNGTSTSNKKVSLNGKTLPTLIIAADAVEFTTAATIENLTMNTAGKATGTKVAKGITITVVTSFTGNGKAGSVVIIKSNEGGKSFTFSKASGVVSLDFLELTDSHAGGGALWYAGANSLNVSGNEGWKFEARPVREFPSVVPAGTTSAATATGTAAKVLAPAGILDKDVAIIKLAVESGGEAEPVITPPAGFELIGRRKIGSPRNEIYYWFRYVGGGATTWEFTFASLEFSWSCSLYRGCIPTGIPYENATFSTGSATTANITHPGITVSNKAEMIFIGASDEHGFTINPAANYNTRVSVLDELVIDKQSTATGATGEVTLVMNGLNAGGVAYAILMLGLLPNTPIAQGQSASLTRVITRNLSVTQGQAASVEQGGKVIKQTLSVTQGQAVVKVAAVARTLSAGQAQSASKSAAPARTLKATQAQSPVVVRAPSRVLTVSQAQAATFVRTPARVLALAQASAVTLLKAATRTLSVGQAQSAIRTALVARTLKVGQAQAAVLARASARLLSVTQAQVATSTRTPARVLVLTQAQQATIAKPVARALLVGQGQLVTRQTAVARTLTATQAQNATRVASNARTLTTTQAQAVTRTATPTRVLAATQGSSATNSRSPARVLSCGQEQAASFTRSEARTLALEQSSAVTIEQAKVRLFQVGQGQSAIVAKAVARTLLAMQGVTARVVKVVARTLRVGQGQEATRIPSKAFTLTLTVTQAQSATRTAALSHKLLVSQPQSARIVRAPLRRLSVSQPQSATFRRTVARVLLATQGSTATQTSTRGLSLTLTATASSEARMAHSFARWLFVAQSSSASLRNALARVFFVGQSQFASLKEKRVVPFVPTRMTSTVVVDGTTSVTLSSGIASSTDVDILVSTSDSSGISSEVSVPLIESSVD